MSARLLTTIIVASVLSSQSFATTPALSSKRCCRDCRAADTVQRLADGALDLSRGHIRVRVPSTFPFQTSPDREAHFCVWESGWGFEARCVFLPAES